MRSVRAAGAVEGRVKKLPVLRDWEILPGLPPGGRAECKGGARPCPYVNCSENTWTQTSSSMPGRRHNGRMPPTTLRIKRGNNCALDWSAKENSAKVVGSAMQASTRRIEQELAAIYKKLRANGGDFEVVRGALELLGLDSRKASSAASELERVALARLGEEE